MSKSVCEQESGARRHVVSDPIPWPLGGWYQLIIHLEIPEEVSWEEPKVGCESDLKKDTAQ